MTEPLPFGEQLARLLEDSFAWECGDGTGELPASLAALSVEDRATVLAGTHDLRVAIDDLVSRTNGGDES